MSKIIYADGTSTLLTLSLDHHAAQRQKYEVTAPLVPPNLQTYPTALVLTLRCSGFRGRLRIEDVRVLVPPSIARAVSYCPPDEHSLGFSQHKNGESIEKQSKSTMDLVVVQHASSSVSDDPTNLITLLSQASIDRLIGLDALAKAWDGGPMVLVVYVACCPDVQSRVRRYHLNCIISMRSISVLSF